MKIGDEREALAMQYLKHTALGGLVGRELDEAETTYVLWDWEGLAMLAYSQFLKHGKGAFVGPRIVSDQDSMSVAFDYVPDAGGSLPEFLNCELTTALRSHIDHYHPEFDFIVVWLRKDGTARYEVLRSNERLGFRSPRDLYDLRQSTSSARPS